MTERQDNIYAVMFEDDTKKVYVRNTQKKAHEDYLRDNSDRILVSGDLRNGDSGKSTVFGGLWLVRALNRAAAQRLIEKDPYFQKGLRAHLVIYHWTAEEPAMMAVFQSASIPDSK